MKEQIIFHRKKYLKNNRPYNTCTKDPRNQSKIVLFFLQITEFFEVLFSIAYFSQRLPLGFA